MKTLTALFLAALAASAQSFEKDVLPVFKTKCQACHGAGVKTKDLSLASLEGVLHGSESGAVVVGGKRDESPLFRLVRDGKMPPDAKMRLSPAELEAIGGWIDRLGAAPVSQHDVLPVLLLHCSSCHGAQRREGGLDLRTKASILEGGKSGPAFVPGKPGESLVVKRVRAGDMPPKAGLLNAGVKPMGAAEIDKVANWIAQGAPEAPSAPDLAGTAADPMVSAKDRQFWAFQPPQPPTIPKVQHAGLVKNPIDAFILHRLEQKGASLSPAADRLTLIRRAAFDLTGLPPEPAQVKAFAADKRPDAYERLIEDLLASPTYGEKWGRHWLDVAGYADSEGGKLSADLPRANAWRYRDYVIRAFNADKRYDRFLIEQIAGDELADYEHAPAMTQEMADNLVATGFLRMAGDSTSEREVNFIEDRLDVIADEIEVLTSGVMGFTMKCARCHNHKYDPIPQRDYYRMTALLKGAYDEHDWVTPVTRDAYGKYFPGRFLPYIEPGLTAFQALARERERETQDKEIQAEVKEMQAELDRKLEPVKKQILETRLAPIPKALHDDLRALLLAPKDGRDEGQKLLAKRFEKTLKIDLDDAKEADAAFRREANAIEKRIKLAQARRMPEPKVRALWDRGQPSPTYILRRGSPSSFGPPVEPGVPSVLSDVKAPFEIRPPWPGANKTGRRLALARWLTQPGNPLTYRVMVNRIWKHHFGTGIVRSLGNFGKAGAPPTHPELLDWLTLEFVRQGYSMKAMHRLMMTSNTYRQASQATPALEKLDPANQFLGRMPLRRMEAEELNDALLQVAGRLDPTQFGPPDPVLARRDGLVTPVETEKGWRRGIYVNQRRTDLPTLSENFDLPAMNPNCLERSESIVAPQALHLLNNSMVHELAASFAERVRREAGVDPGRQVEQAYWLAMSRAPNPEEQAASLAALAQFEQVSKADGLKKFCHTLMNSASFIYID